jgi:hypothetical protein
MLQILKKNIKMRAYVFILYTLFETIIAINAYIIIIIIINT